MAVQSSKTQSSMQIHLISTTTAFPASTIRKQNQTNNHINILNNEKNIKYFGFLKFFTK